MEEQDKLQKELNKVRADMASLSALAESTKGAKDQRPHQESTRLLRIFLLLRKRELLLLEKLGSAAGLAVGSTAGAGRKLWLRPDSQNQDLFFFEPVGTNSGAAAATPGVSSRFFLDPEGRQTDELQDWLQLVDELHRDGEPILPLFINGQVKHGKSYMLNEVLPAVANTYFCSGGSGRQHAGAVLSEPNFLRVDCLDCDRNSGCGGFLKGFLLKLKRSAADQQLSAAASTPVPSNCSAGVMADAIQDFMRRLPRDRLNFLLIDEVESFYLMTRPVSGDCPPRGSTLDVDAVLHMRRILKELLLDSPHWVAWAVTGSSMATLWANVAATPTNGFPLIMHHRRLNLSPTVSTDVLQVAWQQLKAQAATWDPPLPNDLVWRSPPQIATLAYLCQEWRNSRTASTAAELVEQTMMQKVIPEVLADLRTALQVLGQPAAQLKLLRELLDPMAGVDPAKLPLAFKVLLASFATERAGKLYLDYPPLAQAVTTKSEELLVLGECCGVLAEFHSSGRSEVVTNAYDSPLPMRSKAPGASAAATPKAHLQPHVGSVRPISHLGKRLLGRAAVVQPRNMGRMGRC